MLASGFWMIVVVHLLSCMSPGPDFIMVVKNSLRHTRRLAFYTALGIAVGVGLHCTYCALGLGVVLVKMPWFFQALRFVGAAYLLYLSGKLFFAKTLLPTFTATGQLISISAGQAFKQGFLCNALNPKAALFILGLFIMITKWHSVGWSIFFVFEMTLVTFLWFAFLVFCIAHPRLKVKLLAWQGIISKGLAVFLAFFALELMMVHG